MIQCPKCNSTNIKTERRMDGDSGCVECGYLSKTSNFFRISLPTKVPEEPEDEGITASQAQDLMHSSKLNEIRACNDLIKESARNGCRLVEWRGEVMGIYKNNPKSEIVQNFITSYEKRGFRVSIIPSAVMGAYLRISWDL